MAREDGTATDREFQIQRLQKTHAHLQAKVAEYNGRVYLTSSEQSRLSELKKKKLAAKDALSGLRREG